MTRNKKVWHTHLTELSQKGKTCSNGDAFTYWPTCSIYHHRSTVCLASGENKSSQLPSTTTAMLEIHINFLLPSTQNHFTCSFKSCIFDIEELYKDTFEQSGSWRRCGQYIKNKIRSPKRTMLLPQKIIGTHCIRTY